jgi:type II secretory pathway component PulM
MTHFKDYYYYLKSIRWILNNSLADTTIESSNIQKEKDPAQVEIENVTIPDLEKWSDYKVKRLTEETSMD